MPYLGPEVDFLDSSNWYLSITMHEDVEEEKLISFVTSLYDASLGGKYSAIVSQVKKEGQNILFNFYLPEPADSQAKASFWELWDLYADRKRTCAVKPEVILPDFLHYNAGTGNITRVPPVAVVAEAGTHKLPQSPLVGRGIGYSLIASLPTAGVAIFVLWAISNFLLPGGLTALPISFALFASILGVGIVASFALIGSLTSFFAPANVAFNSEVEPNVGQASSFAPPVAQPAPVRHITTPAAVGSSKDKSHPIQVVFLPSSGAAKGAAAAPKPVATPTLACTHASMAPATSTFFAASPLSPCRAYMQKPLRFHFSKYSPEIAEKSKAEIESKLRALNLVTKKASASDILGQICEIPSYITFQKKDASQYMPDEWVVCYDTEGNLQTITTTPGEAGLARGFRLHFNKEHHLVKVSAAGDKREEEAAARVRYEALAQMILVLDAIEEANQVLATAGPVQGRFAL